MCMDAYDKVGIIRNVIDLMGDFTCQGINIVHENKSVEKFINNGLKMLEKKGPKDLQTYFTIWSSHSLS